MAHPPAHETLVGKLVAGVKELHSSLESLTSEPERQATLKEIYRYFGHENLSLRTVVLRVLARTPEESVRAGLRMVNDVDERVATAVALTLGWLGRKTPDDQERIVQALDARCQTCSPEWLPEIHRALRYLNTDAAKVVMLREHDRIQGVNREAMLKLETQMGMTRDDRFIEPVVARCSPAQLGGLSSPQALPYLISAEWIAENMHRPEALILARRFGYMDEQVFDLLRAGAVKGAEAAAVRIVNRLQIVTAEMLQAEQAAQASDRMALLEQWADRKMAFSRATLPDDVVEKKVLPAVLAGVAAADRIDQALLFAALRSADEGNLTAKMELPPFETKGSQQMPGWFFFKNTAGFFSRFEQTRDEVRQLLAHEATDPVLRERMLPPALVDFMAGQLETRDEQSSEIRLMLKSKWRAIIRLLNAPELGSHWPHLKRDFADFDEVGLANWKENANAVMELAHSKYARLWKWGVLEAASDARAEEFLRSVAFAVKAARMSAAARATLKLFAYLLFVDPAKEAVRETEWRSAFERIHRAEALGRKHLRPFGMEIQAQGVAEENMAGMKQALEHFGIPSPRRPEFYGMVEAAYRPAFSAETLVLATQLLERLGLFEKNQSGDITALHLSIEGDLGDEAKWMALPLSTYGKRKSKRSPEALYESLKRVMSKGLIHLNPKNQHAGAGTKLTSEVHTEIRTARLQREGATFTPDYRDFMPAAQFLGTAALEYLQRAEGGQEPTALMDSMAALWSEYRNAIEETTNDERFAATRLMSLNWYESTGDAVDASLVPQLAIVQERIALARHFETNPSLAQEFTSRLRATFLDYGRRVEVLVRQQENDPPALTAVLGDLRDFH